jgi:hypothetical protein
MTPRRSDTWKASIVGLALCEIGRYLARRQCRRHGHGECIPVKWAVICTRCKAVIA